MIRFFIAALFIVLPVSHASAQTNGAMIGTPSGISASQNTQGGLTLNLTSNPDFGAGNAYVINSLIGNITSSNATYPSGSIGYYCNLLQTVYNGFGSQCYYGSVSNTSNNAAGAVSIAGGLFSAYNSGTGTNPIGGYFIGSNSGSGSVSAQGLYAKGVNSDSSGTAAGLYGEAYQNATSSPAGSFGVVARAYSVAGSTAEVGGLFAGIACLATSTNCEAQEISNQGSTRTVPSGIYFQNSASGALGSSPAYGVGILFPPTGTSSPLIGTAYFSDAGTGTNTQPYGSQWANSNFTTAEYAGPSLMIGPTVTSYNSRVEVLGSASAAPGLTVVGAGGTPATNANLTLAALGTGTVNATAPVVLPNFIVSALPPCNAARKYALAAVSDATAPTFNGTLTGGGAVVVPAFCNGTSWLAH